MVVEGHYELLPAQGSPTKLGHSQQEFQWNEEPSVPSSPCSIDLPSMIQPTFISVK